MLNTAKGAVVSIQFGRTTLKHYLREMNTMQQLTVLAVLSLCCTSRTSGTGDCHPEGPEDCKMDQEDYSPDNRTVCSWSLGSNFTFTKSNTQTPYWFIELKREKTEGQLTSRTACSTEGQTHCLQFLYNIWWNNAIELSVSIKYEEANIAESPVWTMSWSYGWDYGGVPIHTERNFSVVFKAKRLHESSISHVFIEDISYVKSRPCTTWPPNAATPALTTAQTTQTAAPTTIMTSVMSSYKVVVILGVIVAVLIVIIIVMAVLLVVFRGKHLQFLKACCRKKQPQEQFRMNASHNAAYSLDTNDQSHTNEPDINNTQQNSDNQRESAQNSINHIPENPQASNETAAPLYAVKNKPQKGKQENSPSAPFKPDTTVYELCYEHAMDRTKAAKTEYQNLPPTVAKQEQDSHSNSSTPLPTVTGGNHLAKTQNPNSVYHILEKGLETDSKSVNRVLNSGEYVEYNRLDLDTKSGDEEKSEEATGGVYSHLNEGGEDTYNNVHREKRDDVIDGVYSHIK